MTGRLPPLSRDLGDEIGRIGAVDVLVGIPSFNNERTIGHVVRAVVALAVGVNALEPGALRNVLSEAVGFLPRLLGAVNAGLPWARVGARALTLALAFGLGARDLARGGLEKKLRAEEDSGIRHV